MAAPERKEQTQVESETNKQTNLTGTLASVFILGLFLAVVWVSVYSLFVHRLG